MLPAPPQVHDKFRSVEHSFSLRAIARERLRDFLMED